MPGEWFAGVNKPVAVSIYKDVHGAMIHLSPEVSGPDGGWSVSIIGSDRWDRAPHILRNASFEQACEKAIELANALDADAEIETLAPIPPAENTDEHQDDPDDALYEIINAQGVVTETGFESRQEATDSASEYDDISPDCAPHRVQIMDDGEDTENSGPDDGAQFGLSAF